MDAAERVGVLRSLGFWLVGVRPAIEYQVTQFNHFANQATALGEYDNAETLRRIATEEHDHSVFIGILVGDLADKLRIAEEEAARQAGSSPY